jgi:hypothetical protein
MACTFFAYNITRNVPHHIENFEDAGEAWDTLCDISKMTKTELECLYDQVAICRQAEYCQPAACFRAIRYLCKQILVEKGGGYSDSRMIIKILTGLSSKYADIVGIQCDIKVIAATGPDELGRGLMKIFNEVG